MGTSTGPVFGYFNGNPGTVFKITPSGTMATLHTFCSETGCRDGEWPSVGLVQGTDGRLYGATGAGGTNSGGTVFRIRLTGNLTTLYSFVRRNSARMGKVREH